MHMKKDTKMHQSDLKADRFSESMDEAQYN